MTRQVKIRNIFIGGGAPVTVQSMNNIPLTAKDELSAQINKLAAAGCEITRSAVPDMASAEVLQDIVASSPIPVVADIHFDWKLALAAIASGADAVRINPGNIGSRERVKAVAEAAGNAGIPIRVGVNAGSIAKDMRRELLQITDRKLRDEKLVQAMLASAINECKALEDFGFTNIVVSMKASSVPVTVAACRKFAALRDYPQHLGITEAGLPADGIVKSAIGIGALLLDGIGDTVRVSLTGDPVQEVYAAKQILQASGIRSFGIELISCPGCGRTRIDLEKMASAVRNELKRIEESGKSTANIKKVAVMGCAVNGPGEASDADLGLAGGDGCAVIFEKGIVTGKYPQEEALAILLQKLNNNTVSS